jgi:hypothetical protein
MTDDVIEHPQHTLMLEARHERKVVYSPEADILKNAIFDSVRAYSDFLQNKGLVWVDDADSPFESRMKAQALVVTCSYCIDPHGTIDINLKDGALDLRLRQRPKSRSLRARSARYSTRTARRYFLKTMLPGRRS